MPRALGQVSYSILPMVKCHLQSLMNKYDVNFMKMKSHDLVERRSCPSPRRLEQRFQRKTIVPENTGAMGL